MNTNVIHYTLESGDYRTESGFEWAEVVLKYLKEHYAEECRQCEIETGGKVYKILKRDSVTSFYDADGETLFDVTNERLKKEYEAMESIGEAEPQSEIGKAIAGIEKQAFDEAVYMGKASLADILTWNVPDPTPEEVQKAMEEQVGAEEAEGDEPSDDSCNQDIEEAHDTETQEISEKGGKEEKADTEPTAKGIDGAVAKLQKELKKAKDKTFADPVIKHLIERCNESESLASDICQEHKTWEKCYKYIYEQARKQAKGSSCAVRDDVVYEWAEDYFRKDDKAEEEKKAKEAAEKKKKQEENRKADNNKPKTTDKSAEKPERKPETPKSEPKPKKNGKDMDGQMDMFSFMNI